MTSCLAKGTALSKMDMLEWNDRPVWILIQRIFLLNHVVGTEGNAGLSSTGF